MAADAASSPCTSRTQRRSLPSTSRASLSLSAATPSPHAWPAPNIGVHLPAKSPSTINNFSYPCFCRSLHVIIFFLQILFFIWYAVLGLLLRVFVFTSFGLPFAAPLLLGTFTNSRRSVLGRPCNSCSLFGSSFFCLLAERSF